MRGLFLNAQPRRPSQVLSALRLIRTDCSLSGRAIISLSVKCLCSSISPATKASCATRLEDRRRTYGRGDSSPIFARAIQRIALDTPTLNRAAACRVDQLRRLTQRGGSVSR